MNFDINVKDGSALLRISGGPYYMGSEEGTAPERPRHEVELDEYVAKGWTLVSEVRFYSGVVVCFLWAAYAYLSSPYQYLLVAACFGGFWRSSGIEHEGGFWSVGRVRPSAGCAG